MKPKTHPLLSDLLAKDEDFRAATLHQVRTLARRRRIIRRSLRISAALATALLFIYSYWFDSFSTQSSVSSQFEVIHTAPLATTQLVQTQPGFFRTIQNSPTSVAIIPNGLGNFQLVETSSMSPSLNFLTDKQLLVLLSKHRAALIYPNTDQARLIFY